jgi:hypothetical protein
MLFFFTGLGLAVGLAVYDAMVRRGWPALPDDLEDDEDWDADQDWDADDLDETESSAEAAADEPEAVDEGTTSTTEDGAATSR